MRRVFIALAMFLLIFTACEAPEPLERPNQLGERPNQYEDELDDMEDGMDDMDQKQNELEDPDLQTDESSIFKQGEVKNCRITANVVDVMNGAGNKFGKVGSLNKNDVVKVLRQLGDWYVVQLDNNQVGAIDASKARPIVKEGEDQDEGTPIQQPDQGQVPDNRAPEEQVPNKNQTQPQENQRNRAETDTNIKPLSSMEQQMVDLVNGERSKNGLSPLTVDLEVARVAEMKSQDMVENNYFSHNSPTYGSPFDMMREFGIDYLAAGENLAGNSSVEGAHSGLMNSSGHRRNILKPEFTHIGIGIRPSDRYGYVFTQMFISKPK